MPWIILSANGEELQRRELRGPLVVGRSPECDIAVRDILLSRVHARIEPFGKGWRIVDLNSKNGTRVGWQGVQTHVLRDGDHLRMGRTRIEYHTGPFEASAEPERERLDRLVRPADPHEALSGTVTDFVLIDDEESGNEEMFGGDRPFPQPRPMEPVSLAQPEVQTLLEDLAADFRSGAQRAGGGTATAQRKRSLPRPSAKPVYREIRRVPEADVSLQADHRHLPAAEVVAVAPKSRTRRRLALSGLVLAVLLGSGIVFMSIWLLTIAP